MKEKFHRISPPLQTFVRRYYKMSALNNLRKKETSLTLGDDLLLAERVGSYNKTFKEHKEKDAVEDKSKKLLKNYVL